MSVENEPLDDAIEHLVLTRLLRMNATITGVVCGLLIGLSIFAATNFLILKGGEVVGPHLSLLSQFFFGYSVTFPGSFVGLAYGFGTGFGLGFIFAWLYNRIAEYREARADRQANR